MRGIGFGLYCFALGWYVRWSGLDEDLAKVARDGYDLAVLHTLQVHDRARAQVGPAPREAVIGAGDMT